MKKIFVITFVLVAGLAMKGYCQTVYASAKGEKYHTADCKLSGDADGMTLAAAKKLKKGACGVCKPDEHIKDKVNTKFNVSEPIILIFNYLSKIKALVSYGFTAITDKHIHRRLFRRRVPSNQPNTGIVRLFVRLVW